MWNCKMCETSNPDHLTRCSACGAAKPSGSSSGSISHNTGTSRTTTTTTTTTTSTGSSSTAASASASKGGSSLGVWVVILLIAAAVYYFVSGGGNSMSLYRDVLLGNKTFISGNTGATATIYETYKCFTYDARHGYPDGFLLADVDNDSKDEIVVSLSEDEYRLVLDAQGSKVYGYLFSFREMKDIYADGTFEASSSAYDSGCYYADFNGRGYSVISASGSKFKHNLDFYSFTSSNIDIYVQ